MSISPHKYTHFNQGWKNITVVRVHEVMSLLFSTQGFIQDYFSGRGKTSVRSTPKLGGLGACPSLQEITTSETASGSFPDHI